MKKDNNKVENNESPDLDELKHGEKTPTHIKVNYACMCVFAFLMGADFAVIIPTLWDRLKIDMQSTGVFMGLVISAYSATGVLSGLIMGYLSDQMNKTKIFFLISILFAVIGHLIYFVGINKYFLLIARSISGLCLGAGTVALAYVAKNTTEQKRISIISLIMATRQFGLMLGPAFNLFLRKLNFKLFDTFVVDRKSSPGLFMAVLWSLSFIVMLIFYRDIKSVESSKTNKKEETTEFLNEEEVTKNSNENETKLTLKEKQHEFFRFEIFVLLAITFFTYFNQTSLETIVTPFTELMFGWGELENSILFCIGGCIIIISYVLIKILSIKFPDRFILLVGVICIFLGLVIGCVVLPFAKQIQNPDQFQTSLYRNKFKKLDLLIPNNTAINSKNETNDINLDDFIFSEAIFQLNYSIDINKIKKIVLTSNDTSLFIKKPIYDYQFFPAFVCFVLLDVLGLPAIAITSASLFTKVVDNKVQGLGQGIQRGILGVGTIVGPLSAGPFVQKPIFLIALSLCFITMILILVVISYRKLKPKTSTK